MTCGALTRAGGGTLRTTRRSWHRAAGSHRPQGDPPPRLKAATPVMTLLDRPHLKRDYRIEGGSGDEAFSWPLPRTAWSSTPSDPGPVGNVICGRPRGQQWCEQHPCRGMQHSPPPPTPLCIRQKDGSRGSLVVVLVLFSTFVLKGWCGLWSSTGPWRPMRRAATGSASRRKWVERRGMRGGSGLAPCDAFISPYPPL